jgi:hypothetical protein
MAGRRLATVVVAAALIVGAFFLRRNVIEGGDDEPDATDGPDPATELVCVTELEALCDALGAAHPELAVTVEDARVTLDRVTGGEPVPLWLTFEPFPAMAGVLVAGDVLGAAELAIATPPGRQDMLAAKCADQPLWRCVGDLAGDAWGEVPGVIEPSVGDAGSTAAGLASFASAVAGYFDTTQLSRTMWESEPEFIPWVQRLVRAVPVEELTAGTPVATMLTRPSAVNVAATNDAELAAMGARGSEVEQGYPEPSMWLQAVLAAPAGADIPQDLTTDAAAAMLDAGWSAADPTAQTPLPSATTMLGLRELWQEVQ